MKPPLPTPEGFTKKEIEAIPVTEGEWRENEDFLHSCGAPALCHPYTNQIWGCRPCCFTTYSVSVCFYPRPGSAAAEVLAIGAKLG